MNTFELILPQGPCSAPAANGNLCAQPLTMPTEFTGRNGAQFKQDTPIEVEGCSDRLSISGHKIKKKTLTVKIYVPAAGKLELGGSGLFAKSKTAKNRETLTIDVGQKKTGRLHTRLRVVFTPAAGKVRERQVKTLKLYFRR